MNPKEIVETDFAENSSTCMEFSQGIEFYERAIATHPQIKSNYWHLGLAKLLQGEEEEAQMTWLSAIADESPEQLDVALSELTQILEIEAQNREAIGDHHAVWLVRQHIRENNPEALNNLLKLILASIEIEEFNPHSDRNLQQAMELLACDPPIEFELTPPTLLSRVLKQLKQLGFNTSSILDENSLNQIEKSIDSDLEEFAGTCISYYQALQDRDPDRALYPFLLGTIYAEVERIEDAIAAYDQALTLNPKYAEVYFGLGNLELNRGNDDEAIVQFQKAIMARPNFAKPYVNLAFVLEKRAQLDLAITYLRQAIQIDPSFVEAHRNLGILLRKQGKIEEAIVSYQQALTIKPNDFMANANLGDVLVAFGKQNEAIPYYQAAIAVQPKNFNVHYELGNIWFRQNQLDPAIACYQAVIEIDPEFVDAYKSLILVLIRKTDLGEPFYRLWRKITEEYAHLSDRLYAKHQSHGINHTWVTSSIMAIRSQLMSGNHQVALERFQILEPQIYINPQDLTLTDIKTLYGELLFFVLFLRDDRAASTKFFRKIGELYLNLILKPTQDASLLQLSANRLPKSQNRGKLKIGILSKSFRRHATAWCCFNFIEELSKLTTELYLYDTGKFRDDDMTAKFELLATKYYRTPTTVTEEIGILVTAEILKDEVDIVLELDSMMNVASAEILSYHPAPVCVSWPGLEAPFLSDRNYFLCDRHLLPKECDRHYIERIVRMPDSYLAVTDLKHDPIDRNTARAALGITSTQIVYLSITAGHKFNRAVAKAAVEILRQVPNSVLLCKGKGDPDLIRGMYQQECDLLGVDSDRIKFLPPRTSTEEAHRSTYLLADVLLDSHPYNSCTHTLEALWLNLPIVTIVGDQFFARFGYSFLQTLNLQAGIAWNWEEYVNWAVKLGMDWELRNSIRQKIAQSKLPETLSPLWNPQKFAIDMYAIFNYLWDKNFNQNFK
jgi:protein O-GlcNAc transferase